MQPANNFDWRAADAYLFDIDGTLLNTRDGVHYYSFRNVLKNIFGLDASLEGVPVHGNTDVGILRAVIRRAGISDASFEEKLPLIVQQMSDEVESKRAEIRADVCSVHPGTARLSSRLRQTIGHSDRKLRAHRVGQAHRHKPEAIL